MARTQQYWKDRFNAVQLQAEKIGLKAINPTTKAYKEAYSKMLGEVSTFYAKYGTIQESPKFKTLEDGTKVITGTTRKLVVTPESANVKLVKGTRLTKLEGKMSDILNDTIAKQNTLMKKALKETAENAYYNTIFTIYKGAEFGTSFNILNQTVINQLIKNPLNGQDFVKRNNVTKQKMVNSVKQVLNNGIIQGLSSHDMTQQLQNITNTGIKNAKRIIQTETNNTLNQASLDGYKQSGIVDKYQYDATLDESTSAICTELDGQVFEVEKATAGVNYPPMHPNCRSSTIPFFDKTLEEIERVARAEDGSVFTVPAKMKAQDFKDIYVDKTITRAQWNKSN